jgi:hypothetical protein
MRQLRSDIVQSSPAPPLVAATFTEVGPREYVWEYAS